MIIVKFNRRVYLPDFKAIDITETKKFHRVEFHGGILYGWRSKYAIKTITEDEVSEIEDTDCPGAYIDVFDSFKAQELAYCLPF